MKRMVSWLAEATALAGGVVLTLIILMTALSIAGRALIPVGLGPVPGDYELTEMGMAFAIFCFLPLCHLRSGHATVDVFTGLLGAWANRIILAVWDVLLTASVIFIAWRLYEGLQGKLSNHETTMFLQFPVWWAYLAAMVPATVAVIVGLWSAADRAMAVIRNRDTRPIEGAGH